MSQPFHEELNKLAKWSLSVCALRFKELAHTKDWTPSYILLMAGKVISVPISP